MNNAQLLKGGNLITCRESWFRMHCESESEEKILSKSWKKKILSQNLAYIFGSSSVIFHLLKLTLCTNNTENNLQDVLRLKMIFGWLVSTVPPSFRVQWDGLATTICSCALKKKLHSISYSLVLSIRREDWEGWEGWEGWKGWEQSGVVCWMFWHGCDLLQPNTISSHFCIALNLLCSKVSGFRS